MNEIEKVNALLVKAHPEASIQLTPPANSDGIWWLDIVLREKRLVVEWSALTNFMVTTPDSESYGEKADEGYSSFERIVRRIKQLLTTDDRTSPPLPVLLARLREMRGVTQQELASKLGIRQASVSGFERRSDMQLSTLRRLVRALGGSVQIFARFPEGRFCLDDDSLLEADQSEQRAEQNVSSDAVRSFASGFVQLTCAGKMQQALDLAGRVKRNHFLFEMN